MAEINTENPEKGVQIVSLDNVPGYRTVEIKGLVWASSVRAKFILSDLIAMGRILLGGEIHEYRDLMNETRHEILQRLNKNTKEMGANAVLNVRMVSSQIVPGTVEILAYGTAAIIEKE